MASKEETQQLFSCDVCNKIFTTRQAKCRHKKHTCRGAGTTSNGNNTQQQLKDLGQQVKDLSKRLETQHQLFSAQLLQLSQQIQVQQPTRQVTSSVTNVVIVNTITVNNFRCEDLSYLTHERVRDLVKCNDLNQSLQTLVQLIHFNPEQPRNLNVYLPAEDAQHGFFWKNGWMKQNTADLARLVMLKVASIMCEHNDTPYTREYSQAVTKRFDRFYERFDVHCCCKQQLLETITTMATHSYIVNELHPSPLANIPVADTSVVAQGISALNSTT